MKSKQTTLILPPAPPALRFEDVNWPAIFEQEDFRMMGLCNRHVQIDNTGRDWYGLPLLVDAEAYPKQGSPYCLPFTRWDEKNLNHLLWQLHYLNLGHYAPTERAAYRWYLTDCETAKPLPLVPLSAEQYFLRRVIWRVRAQVYPSPRSARYYLVYQTPEELTRLDAEAEARHCRYSSNLERFGRLDFLGKIIFALEGLVRSQRQAIYFEKLLAQAEAKQQLVKAERRRESNQHWYSIDQQRETDRLQRLARRRAGAIITQPIPIQQPLFEAA